MSQGNLASWAVEEGAEIAAGDVLAEIETDKATLTWDMQVRLQCSVMHAVRLPSHCLPPFSAASSDADTGSAL